jgi:transposase
MSNSYLIQEAMVPAPVDRLEVFDVEDHRIVDVNGHRIAQYQFDDYLTERVLMTQLAEVSPIKDREIARAFGIHATSLSRYRAMTRSGGTSALLPLKTGPRKPSKLTPEMRARIIRLREQEGLSSQAIAKRLSRDKRSIGYRSVSKVLREHREEPQQTALALETPSGEKAEREIKVERKSPESQSSRYAGSMLLYAALQWLGLWEVLKGVGARVGAWRRFDAFQTVGMIVMCFALRFHSIEDLKNGRRKDLGAIIGAAEGPSLQTLRRKVMELSESLDPKDVSRELFRRYLELEPVWEGLYYVDGHFCPYYGGHPTAKGWNSQRHMAMPGHTDVYIHDVRGRVLFFLSQPLNDSLARSIPRMVEEIRRAHGETPFTLVFDRGGYSPKLFRWLSEEKIGFISYLRGRKAKRRYAEDKFESKWYEFEKKRHYYWIYEKKTRLHGAGLIRTLVWLDEDGQQIPVLTNLDQTLKPACVVHCLRLRWRQENALKYLKEHYAIDQIIQYGAQAEVDDERRMKNPARVRLKSRIDEVRQEIQAMEAEIGRALETNSEGAYRTTRGLKIALSRQRKKLVKKREVLNRLKNRLRHTPAEILASEQKDAKPRMLLHEDRRLLVNAFKLIALNAERLLAMRLNKYYQQSKDVLSVFRSLLHLPGHIDYISTERLEVRLARPQPEKLARALESLLEELNRDQLKMFDSGPMLHFSLVS